MSTTHKIRITWDEISLSDYERTVCANAAMRQMSSVACACLRGKVPDDALPTWENKSTLQKTLDAADAWADYCRSYGWEVCEYLMSDWLLDNMPGGPDDE
jgi:hypothetical protein